MYEAQYELSEHGFSAGCGKTFRGEIIAVEHALADRAVVDAIVFEVDATAHRY